MLFFDSFHSISNSSAKYPSLKQCISALLPVAAVERENECVGTIECKFTFIRKKLFDEDVTVAGSKKYREQKYEYCIAFH